MSKSQINLPKTAFSMKANLPTREPEILDYWQKIKMKFLSLSLEKSVDHLQKNGLKFINLNLRD